MLTSSQESIPLRGTPMEEDVLCAIHHDEPQPHAICHSSVLHSCNDIRESSSHRRSGRHLRSKDEPEERSRPANSARALAQQINTTLKERASRKSHENTDDIQWRGDETVRGCKRKLELGPNTTQSQHSKNSTSVEDELGHSSVDLETKCTESPPPAKRWVIGPLLQSFKSKMASFTEIVMSPVRLFKPSDASLSNSLQSSCEEVAGFNKECFSSPKEEQDDVAEDVKEEVFSKDKTKSTPRRESAVVQRLRFNTNPNDNQVGHSQSQKDGLSCLLPSFPEDDSSNTRNLTNQFEELSGSLSIQEPISHNKPAYEKEVFEATSTSENSDVSNLAQEKFGCTKPILLIGLTDIAHTHGIKSQSPEAPHQSTSSISLCLTESGDQKGALDCEEPDLRIPIRTSPRKTSNQPSEIEGLSNIKLPKKASETLADVGNDLKPKVNVKTHTHNLSNDGFITASCGTEKKRKGTLRTKAVRSLEKEEVVMKGISCSKKIRKKSKLDHVDKSPTVRISRMGGILTSVDKRRKVQASDDLSLSVCNAQVVLEVMGSGACASWERTKIGQDRASRSKSLRDAQCRTPTALGFESSNNNNLCSSDAMKSALTDTVLLGNSTDLTDMSDCSGFTPVEAHQPIKSTSPKRMVAHEPSRKFTRSQNMRRCKVMLCKVRNTEDLGTVVETQFLAGKPTDPSAKDEHLGHEEMGSFTDRVDSKITQRNRVRQAKHKPETSSAASGVSSFGQAVNKATVDTNQSETRAAKRATDAIEEQRVSMSLTLQVGADVDEQEGDLILPPVHSASSTLWQTARPVNCRITRSSGKTGNPAGERKGMSKSTSMDLKDQDLINEGHGQKGANLDKRDVLKKKKKLKVDRRKRKCAYLVKKKGSQGDAMKTRNLKDDAVLRVPSSGSGSSRLLRSFSCPDIPSLLHCDGASVLSLHDPVPPSPPKTSCPAPPHPPHPHSPSRRARRHTVCSVEIEREIAPLCLRKEVCPYSHASSLTALASTFLSSPLAFLSKKSSQGHCDDDLGLPCTSPRRFTKSSSPSFLKSPTSPTLTVNPAFSASVPHTPEQPSAPISSPCSVFEPVPMEAEVVQQECEEDEQSNFSLELSSRSISEEKALSDSDIKADDKQVERRKVSSIRIRKTLPKPQYNLTPMGLPKAIRIKKKVFSVEEIYTNKNFSKPPERRLETVFEEPLSRRDGSQSMFSQKRVKRFVEFPELGVARKPRKPLVGAAGLSGAQRKAAGNSGAGRTRRGVWASAREEDAFNPQDLDSLLCSKLNELDSWMAVMQLPY